MKISNELKVGALTAIAVTLLILGFNFLKGQSLLKTGTFIYAKYRNAQGLAPSNPVFVNGFRVGAVYEIEPASNNISAVVIAIKLNADYDIPDNSVAAIQASSLGLSSPTIVIKPGNSNKFLKSGDTLSSEESVDLFATLSEKLDPISQKLQSTLTSLDTVLQNLNTVLDPSTKNNLQGTIANLNKASASIVGSAASLQQMLNQQSGSLAKSLDNVNSITKNLADNNGKINNVLANMEKTTENLSKADVDGAINSLKSAIDKLNGVIAKINSTEGSLGALINSKDVYNNLNNTVHSMNILLDDLRAHPKRYVNISVFGKKDKGDYLTQPLTDSVSSPEKK
ncbi:MAG TPA: MlaD family protein [Chitinophagaceae bacterium]|nr:MlaD family protein [Chitinophagaceae bacterium]